MTEHLDSPSGTVLKHTGSGSNWVLASELGRVLKAIHDSACSRNQDWLGTSCKYVDITVRVDMRTGHFIIKDQNGKRVDGDDAVLQKFGIHKERDFSELDEVPTDKTKYVILRSDESPDDPPCLKTLPKIMRNNGFRKGDRYGTEIIVGFADNLTHAQGHLGPVVRLETPQ